MSQIIQTAVKTIETEASSLINLIPFVNDDFERAVRCIYESKGRLVVCGIGKSAIIAQKIVASLNSTGTPSIFLHAADAIHGDLGMIQIHDVVMMISKSGNTPEIKVLIPIIRNFQNTIIGMCGNTDSALAGGCDILINTTVAEEACKNNLAPTSSTMAQLAMGDAIAVCLMELRGFGPGDFAKFHPGGMLGKQLYMQVGDLSKYNERPEVDHLADIRDIIIEISQKRLGVTVVLHDGAIAGIITDGDLRRMLQNQMDVQQVTAKDIMTKNPKTIDDNALAVEALELMRKHNITQLVVTSGKKYKGIIHLHDLIREGIL